MRERIIYEIKPNEINNIIYKLDDVKFKNIIIDFDFKESTVVLNETKKLRVENDSEFVYRFLKTKIKAIGGIDGLYKHIKEASEPSSFWNNRMYGVLHRALS
jgi:hypothetical protein